MSRLAAVFLVLILIGIAGVMIVRSSLVAVVGRSMEPGYANGSYYTVNRLAYFGKGILRGDVVIYHPTDDTSREQIGRVVGLPGESISLESGDVKVNGVVLTETYVAVPHKTGAAKSATNEAALWTLGPEEYFIFGDNRTVSRDSRTFGPVGKKDITAEVLFRVR